MPATHPFTDIVFDCDSTLSTLEGIDELARGRAEIAELTRAAMEGALPLEDAYRRRLERVAPTRAAVDELGRAYAHTLVRDALTTIAALQAAGKRVHLMSGSLRPALEHLADHLHVPRERVHAVAIAFDRAGNYNGYEIESPLTRSSGKAELVRALRTADARARIALVGDGATDLAAAPELELFIGFCGVVERPAVRAGAPVCITCDSLAPVLLLVLTEAELARLDTRRDFKPVLRRARQLSERGGLARA